MERRRLAFRRIADASLGHADAIVRRWLPNGVRDGREWVAHNPVRDDRHRGSFKVNLATGRWADFATGDRGADLIALAAYLFRVSQGEAAIKVAGMLGIEPYEQA